MISERSECNLSKIKFLEIKSRLLSWDETRVYFAAELAESEVQIGNQDELSQTSDL